MNRRDFLRTTLVAGATAAGCSREPSPVPASSSLSEDSSQEPLYRISLAQWSLHRALFGGEITTLDFAALAADHQIFGIEYVNQFFKDRASDSSYIGQLAARADDVGVASLLIMCDDEGRLGDPDERLRLEAVDKHLRWLDAAAALGCHSIRVNAHSEGSARATRSGRRRPARTRRSRR